MLKRTIIPAIVAIFALVACTKEIQNPEFGRPGSTEIHSLSVGIESGSYLPADEIKASMEAIVRVNWEENNEVSVVNATTGMLLGGCLKAAESGEVVTFSGNVAGGINAGDKLYYIYPRVAENDNEVAFAGYEIDLSKQQYAGNNVSNVCFCGYAEETYAATASETETTSISKRIKFNLVTAYVHLNMSNIPTNGEEEDLKSVDLSNVNGGFKWVCDKEKSVVSTEYCFENKGISVTCTNAKITGAGNAVVRFAVPASPATEEARKILVNKVYLNSNYKKDARKAAAYYNQLYTTWQSNVTVEEKSDKVEVTIDNAGSTEAAEGILPVEKAFKSGKNEGTSIQMGGVGTITFDKTATEKILDNAKDAGSTNVFFKIEDVTEDKDVQAQNIVYEVTMKTVDEKGVEVFSEEKTQGSDGVATIKVPLGDNVLSVESVSLLDENEQPITGGVQSYKFDSSSRILTIKVVHFSKYAIKYTEKGGPTNYVAQIGETKYETLAAALNAAKEGEAVYIIPAQLEETVSALNDNNIQLILDGKAIVGNISFGGKGTLIVRAEELNKDYYSYLKAYEVDAPTIPAQGVGGIMGKISATDDATVMLRENLYSGPFEGNVELRGGFYYSELGFDNIKAQTPSGIGLVVNQVQNVMGYDMYYVPEVPESYLVHFPNVAELMTAYIGGQLSDEQINQITFGYGLGERIMQPWWFSVDGGDNSLAPTGGNYFPDDVYAFFTNLRDGEYDNPKYAYQDWLCDYVISYSEPIKKDYQSGIWGYYSNMSIGCWLPSSVTQAPFAMLSAVNLKRSYSQMLSDVGMFLCGPKNLNPADASNVITVSLNIYPDSESDKYITTNKVVYVIPQIQ